MARRKRGTLFTEAVGKTVHSISYEENPDWQALVITFTDDKVISFEFGARVVVRASYLQKRRGELKMTRNYGRISGDLDH